jgi:hypothetical protein
MRAGTSAQQANARMKSAASTTRATCLSCRLALIRALHVYKRRSRGEGTRIRACLDPVHRAQNDAGLPESEKNIFSLSLILIYASIFAFANNKNLTAPHILFFLCVGEFLS